MQVFAYKCAARARRVSVCSHAGGAGVVCDGALVVDAEHRGLDALCTSPRSDHSHVHFSKLMH